MLSFVFLFLVCVNGGFRFYINLYKGRLGERMLRRLRYELIDRLMRFPIPRFKRLKSPEIASMVKDEVEPLGGFIGDAFVQPVFLTGQALTVMAFIITQNYMLGLIALGIVFLAGGDHTSPAATFGGTRSSEATGGTGVGWPGRRDGRWHY